MESTFEVEKESTAKQERFDGILNQVLQEDLEELAVLNDLIKTAKTQTKKKFYAKKLEKKRISVLNTINFMAQYEEKVAEEALV